MNNIFFRPMHLDGEVFIAYLKIAQFDVDGNLGNLFLVGRRLSA